MKCVCVNWKKWKWNKEISLKRLHSTRIRVLHNTQTFSLSLRLYGFIIDYPGVWPMSEYGKLFMLNKLIMKMEMFKWFRDFFFKNFIWSISVILFCPKFSFYLEIFFSLCLLFLSLITLAREKKTIQKNHKNQINDDCLMCVHNRSFNNWCKMSHRLTDSHTNWIYWSMINDKCWKILSFFFLLRK